MTSADISLTREDTIPLRHGDGRNIRASDVLQLDVVVFADISLLEDGFTGADRYVDTDMGEEEEEE